jgi:hypothetical protein
MRQRIALLGCGLVAGALVSAGAALGDRPTKEPSPLTPVSFPAGDLCTFPVTWEPVVSDGFTITFVDSEGNFRWLFGGGHLVVRITNDSTGQSIELNISGPGKITENDDGTLTLEGGGPFLLGFLPSDTPASTMLLVKGRVVLRIDPSTGQLTLVSHRGTSEDLCASLG